MAMRRPAILRRWIRAVLRRPLGCAGHGWQEEFYVCVSKSGREVPVPGSGVAHVDGQGNIIGFTGALRRAETGSLSRRERQATRERVTDVLHRRALQIVFQPIVDSNSGQVVGA